MTAVSFCKKRERKSSALADSFTAYAFSETQDGKYGSEQSKGEDKSQMQKGR